MRHLSLTIVLLAGLNCGFSAADTHDDYQAGIRAFNDKNYEQAALLFNRALVGGLDQPTLHYNVGVVYYKLAQYAESRVSFEKILHDQQWNSLALYNLGLVAEASGDATTAVRYYQEAYNTSKSPKIAELARQRLDVGQGQAVKDDRRWAGFFSSAFGFDDNVVLIDAGTVEEVSDTDDYFLEALGATSKYISGDYDKGWRAEFGGYYRLHQELDEFDYGAGSAGLSYNRSVGNWHLQVGGTGYLRSAGREHFTSTVALKLSAYRPLESGFAFLTSYESGYVEGAGDYDYLTGTQNRATVEFSRPDATTRFRFGYQLEFNDRKDLSYADEFYSYSPTRHRLFANVEQRLTDTIDGLIRLAFRSSDYGDQNIQISLDGTVTQKTRKEDRLIFGIRVGYSPSSRWRLFTEYEYADNDSNFDQYSYQGNRLMLGFEADF